MKRNYIHNSMNLQMPGPKGLLELAKLRYLEKYHKQPLKNAGKPFPYFIVYLVVKSDKTMMLDFKFPPETKLLMKFIHKRPGGAIPNEAVRNIDIREITKIIIPLYENKYYFDFIIYVLDITTNEYWVTNLWTSEVCPDLRYYLSTERKRQYHDIGVSLAKSYNETFILGHINLKTGKLKSSSGIDRLVNHGWIPSVSLLPQPYGEMIRIIESTNDMNQVNANAVKLFSPKILDEMLDRWRKSSLLRGRESLLSTAIERYQSNDYISSIHILLPQIEGLVTKHLKRRSVIPLGDIDKRFKQFDEVVQKEKYNTEMTKYLSKWLVSYLKKVFYKTWYPYSKNRLHRMSRIAPQRHVILHGEVHPAYFKAENCLKLLCVVDAIILLSLTRNELRPLKRIT